MDKPFKIDMPLHVDDRGSVYCAIDNMDSEEIKRTYVVNNWKAGMIRAWHGHQKGWTGLHVIHGAAKVVARDITEEGLPGLQNWTFTLSDRNPGIVWVPPGYFNGAMSLVDNTKILVYSTLTFEECKQDDVRAKLQDWDLSYWKVVNR